MTVKKIFGKLHLWFGLASGLIMFMVCTTAAIWAFSPEIEDLTASYRHVKRSDAPVLPPSVLKTNADQQLKGHHVNRLYYYGREKAAVAEYYDTTDFYHAVYLNPSTGKVLKERNEAAAFFRVIIIGHYSLWLGNVGNQVVKWATLIFFFMFVSGIVLWWPRNKAARKQRFKLKLDASPKRLNYDLHNVLGFYASWVLIFAVLTGIIWTFDFATKAEYFVASGGKINPGYPQLVVKKMNTIPLTGIDSVYATTLAANKGPLASSYIAFPDTDSAAVEIGILPGNNNYHLDHYYFDPNTFESIPVKAYGLYKNANAGEKMDRMNYDIHIGNILGMPGRIAMFLAALVGASLPITGFYIWWGRNKKKPAKKSRKDKQRKLVS